MSMLCAVEHVFAEQSHRVRAREQGKLSMIAFKCNLARHTRTEGNMTHGILYLCVCFSFAADRVLMVDSSKLVSL